MRNTYSSYWLASQDGLLARCRAGKVPDPRQRCVYSLVFQRIKSNPELSEMRIDTKFFSLFWLGDLYHDLTRGVTLPKITDRYESNGKSYSLDEL